MAESARDLQNGGQTRIPDIEPRSRGTPRIYDTDKRGAPVSSLLGYNLILAGGKSAQRGAALFAPTLKL